MSDDLTSKHCVPCEGGVPALNREQAESYLEKLTQWNLDDAGKVISRRFKFQDFKLTMLFVNRLAEIAESEDHHPDLQVGYGYCHVTWSTHAVGGLSENDFICAAKTDLIDH